ncbi:MAG: SRPBCC domain-containing protein [Myxococcota bacterium]|nr:SRPBCC domain-containing protein [Myxococcota bacterium]
MSDPDRVEKTIELRAPRSRVWRAISNGKDFGAWFGLGTPLTLVGDFVPGARISGEWMVDGKPVHEHFCTIEKVEPERLLSFAWVPYELSPGDDPAKHPTTHVELRLEDIPDGTRLTVVESGFAKLPADKQYKRDENGEGWALQVHSIGAHVLGLVPVRVEYAIERPVADVLDAIVDPAKMAQYFISRGSGPMTSGAKLTWHWDDVSASATVRVREASGDRITFLWAAGGAPTQVTLALTADGTKTKLVATEDPFERSEAGVARALQQTQGWTDFCCSLRAYLHHGVNLRANREADRVA